MNSCRISFIGGGNMALAIAQGLINAGKTTADSISIYEISPQRREFLREKGFNAVETPGELDESYITFLAVKPAHAKTAAEQYCRSDARCSAVVSIVAGLSTKSICGMFDGNTGVIRIMPNTPTLVGMGMFAISDDYTAANDAVDFVKDILSGIGEVTTVSSSLMDAVTAVSGSGPAYVFMFIDAMASAGVRLGLSRKQAMELTLQTIAGSVEMVRQTGTSPSDLKDMVCSPAGTTIEAVYALEQGAFSAVIMDAIYKCAQKSKELSAGK